ncbi:MAG: hypothetical protein IPM64_14770 [Phycisphaerales bacterium]|nr:hypothetical protein [Phycisphaerales bacterium]
MRSRNLLGAAALLALISGCAETVNIQFTREERINTIDDKSAGRPLDVAVVLVTPDDVKRNPQLDPRSAAINSLEWFSAAESNRGTTPYNLPLAQVRYFTDSESLYGTKLGPPLPGFLSPAEPRLVRWGKAPEDSAIFIFARYQDERNAVRPTRPVILDIELGGPDPYVVHVGGRDLSRTK